MKSIIQELSSVYVTLQDIEIKGKQSVVYAMCIQALERSITELNKYQEKGGEEECQTN